MKARSRGHRRRLLNEQKLGRTSRSIVDAKSDGDVLGQGAVEVWKSRWLSEHTSRQEEYVKWEGGG